MPVSNANCIGYMLCTPGMFGGPAAFSFLASTQDESSLTCRGPDKKDSWMPAHDKLTKKWTMPFVMQPINTRVVRRSNALLGNLYGQPSCWTV